MSKNDINPQLELWEKDTIEEKMIKYKKLYEKAQEKIQEYELIIGMLTNDKID